MIELDKRIIEDKKPLTPFDVSWELVGANCYFSNNANDYEDLSNCQVGKLLGRTMTGEFNTTKNNSYVNFNYCLPCEWVKPEEPEKKYRAFSLNEFSELYAIGDVVTYRIKDCKVVEQAMLVGFQARDSDENIPGNAFVLIGNCRYSLKELFNNYELKYLNQWQPFGRY